jgi:hypothetical protein
LGKNEGNGKYDERISAENDQPSTGKATKESEGARRMEGQRGGIERWEKQIEREE